MTPAKNSRKRSRIAMLTTLLLVQNNNFVSSSAAAVDQPFNEQQQLDSPPLDQRTRNMLAKCATPYLPNTDYTAGDIVSHLGRNYMCKNKPYDTWCSHIDYAPGIGTVTEFWSMAWRLVEVCQGGGGGESNQSSIIQQFSGGNDEINAEKSHVIPNKYTDGKFKFKPLPQPKQPTTFQDVQINTFEVADIQPIDNTMQQTDSTLIECASQYKMTQTNYYEAGDIASWEGKNYVCRTYPISQWCNIDSYSPGSAYSYIAWSEKEDCIMPQVQEEVEPAADDNNISALKERQCGPPHQSNHEYYLHDIVSVHNSNYECNPTPNPQEWCNHVTVDYNWDAAWKFLVSCEPGEEEDTDVLDADTVAPAPEEEEEDIPLVEETVDKPTTAPKEPSVIQDSLPQPEEGDEVEDCPLQWEASKTYVSGDEVGSDDKIFRCKIGGWCSSASYEPIISIYWYEAWDLVGHCNGITASPTTSPPTPTPGPTPKLDISGSDNTANDQVYSNSADTAQKVFDILHSKQRVIDNELFLYQGKTPSTVYRYQGFIDGLRVMIEDGVANKYFYLGNDHPEHGYLYGLANIAAFLGQSLKETIQYDACDENSWDYFDSVYPLSNACGQLGQSYQDYHCPEHEKHMECTVDPNMSIKGTTHAKWYGSPAPLFCGPKTEYPFVGKWDYGYSCNNPWATPPEYCEDYVDQQAGRGDNSEPVANRNGRTDVEGCCWWGRGVIQTTGVCNFGKLNYFLGARAAKEGRGSRYTDIDFCKTPDAICASKEHQELKWIAGMFYWVESLQSYDEGGWNYMSELHKYVDQGMTDDSFINAVSGIVNRGCHNPPCGTGPVDGSHERATNFENVLTTLNA